MLDGSALLQRVVGNTLHFHAPSEDVYEYLAPDGTIHGESTVHGKYLARWRLFEMDLLCFQHDDPMASGCGQSTASISRLRSAMRSIIGSDGWICGLGG